MKKELIPDSRFAQFEKEAKVIVGFVIAYFSGFLLIGGTLGGGDVADYSYFCGVPLWFAVAVIFQLCAMAFACVLILKVFPDTSLAADDPNYNYGKEEATND